MKILADVNISPRVVAALRADGFDAVRVTEIMPATSTDEEILAEALRRGAIVVSQDQDFSALLAMSGAVQPSLVNLRVSFVDAARMARTLAAALRGTAEDLREGAIVTIDDAHVRVHRLPVGRS